MCIMRTTQNVKTRIVLTILGFLTLSLVSVKAVNMVSGNSIVIHPSVNLSDADIQSALDQLSATGGTVILAPGTYAIHHPIRMSRDNQALRGDGATTILRLADQANCPVVIMGLTTVISGRMVRNLRLSDLMIDGNRSHQSVERWTDPANTSGIQNNGVMIQCVSNSVVSNVVAAHCRSGGLVTANGTRRLTVDGFTSYDNQFDGLACYRTEDSVFTKLNLHDNRCAGISLDLDFNHNVISDSTLTANDLGIFMRCSFGNEFQNVNISQSRHDGVFMAQWGVFNAASGWHLTPNTECSGNHFASLDVHDCVGVAFRVNDAACVNNTIDDGTFTGNLNGGLVEAGANLVRVEDVVYRKTTAERPGG